MIVKISPGLSTVRSSWSLELQAVKLPVVDSAMVIVRGMQLERRGVCVLLRGALESAEVSDNLGRPELYWWNL